MRIRRRTSECLNCGFSLDKVYNFCPNCGQSNNNNNVSFGTLISDFFSNYFSLDSRFGRTIKPFLFKPGYLTIMYNKGRRMAFANPVRLYLILSLFYFFTINLADLDDDDQQNNQKPLINISNTDDTRLKRIKGVDSAVRTEVSKLLGSEEVERINNQIERRSIDELLVLLGDSTINILRDSLDSAALVVLKVNNTVYVDSLLTAGLAPVEKREESKDDDRFVLNRIDSEKLDKLIENDDLTDEQIIDSLDLGQLSFFEYRMARQMVRLQREGDDRLSAYIIENMPVMMFLLIPVFALILKVFYIRRKTLYIKHLIHALHLHSFAYFFYGLGFLTIIALKHVMPEENLPLVAILFFILVSIYAYVSFLRVYGQHWFKTFIKYNLVGMVYGTTLSIALLIEVIVSALIF
ncbi:MAG: DUF3667 domain-containing protein [Bacteroidota bacterium]